MDHNGEPKVSINAMLLGPGWVYFHAGDSPPKATELPLWLNRGLVDWLREHPGARPRTTLPIVAVGNTVGIHLWFDE